jgi:hypothetical protein
MLILLSNNSFWYLFKLVEKKTPLSAKVDTNFADKRRSLGRSLTQATESCLICMENKNFMSDFEISMW